MGRIQSFRLTALMSRHLNGAGERVCKVGIFIAATTTAVFLTILPATSRIK